MNETITSGCEWHRAPRWFALRTRSRYESLVAQQLTRKNIEAFLPTIALRSSCWKDRKKTIDWPLFPTYCFARFDVFASLPVLSCSGVLDIVSFGGRPTPMPDSEVASLRIVINNTLTYDPGVRRSPRARWSPWLADPCAAWSAGCCASIRIARPSSSVSSCWRRRFASRWMSRTSRSIARARSGEASCRFPTPCRRRRLVERSS